MTKPIKRATLNDVAALAGVSLGSASRALSIPNQVKPDTLEKVNKAVEQLGYVRNGAAQALVSKKTKTVAAIYPTLDNPIYATSVNALQQTLWQKGYQLFIASHEYNRTREIKIVQTMIERGVDGIILVGTDHDPAIFETLNRRQIPYVLTWSTDFTNYPHCIGFSNQQASFDLVQALIAKGHRKIAICTGAKLHNDRQRARVTGALQALSLHSYAIPDEYVIEKPLSIEGGQECVQELMALADPPTAIVFGNDLQAIGAIDQAIAKGMRIPQDLSITGFDDISMAQIVKPSLTTIRVPVNEIGISAANLILNLIHQQTEPNTKLPPLSADIMLRDSVGPPRAN